MAYYIWLIIYGLLYIYGVFPFEVPKDKASSDEEEEEEVEGEVEEEGEEETSKESEKNSKSMLCIHEIKTRKS